MEYHKTGNTTLASEDALLFRGVGPDDTFCSYSYINALVGIDDEESRRYGIQPINESLINPIIHSTQRPRSSGLSVNPIEYDRCLFHKPCLGVFGCAPLSTPG